MVETKIPLSCDRSPTSSEPALSTEITVRLRDDPGQDLTIEARRELDLSTLPSLRAALQLALATTAQRVVVDLFAVDFIDCSSLRPLRDAARSLRREGRALVLRRPSPPVCHLLDLTGIADELTFEASPPAPTD
jgi:anti-anti-sigma factor